jgi:DNA polymerase III subunit epsilon
VSSSAAFVAFDIVTTGLVPGVHRIVELAAVAFAGEEVLGTFEQLVDPGVPIPPEATRVNGIDDRMLSGCPGVREVLPAFLSFLGNGTPVAHNAVFDVGFIAREIEQLCLQPPAGPVLDTKWLARSAFPDRFSYSLPTLARDLGIHPPKAHRALADAHTCRLLFLLCVRELALRQRGTLEDAAAPAELVKRSGPELDFGSRSPNQGRHAAALQAALE